MTEHSPFQDDLKAYADGELPLPRRLAVRLHLTRCASCREEMTQMTQIAEDLRASEPDAALDPTLRAKILGIAPPSVAEAPGTGSAGLLGSESASGTAEPVDGSRSSVAERLPPHSSPALPVPGPRKRPALAWVLAGAALVAWFVLFPLFQHTREADSFGAQSLRQVAQSEAPAVPAAQRPVPASLPAPPPPPKAKQRFTGRLSNGEAGPDTFGSPISSAGNVNASVSDAIGSYPGGGGYPSGASPASPTVPQRQVHKEASIGVQVPNPEATSDKVADMVKETGGFVAGNTLSTGDDGLKSAELTVKVPVVQFETFLGQVARLGNVQSKNITGEDITEKTSDADQAESVLEDDVQKSEARLKALGSRAKWHDEQATRDLRIQLAEARARLVLLKRMAALSTITVDLSQTPKPPAPAPVTGGFLNGLKASTHDALQSLVSSASALVAVVIWLLAYAPLWIPLLLGGRYALREYRKRQPV